MYGISINHIVRPLLGTVKDTVKTVIDSLCNCHDINSLLGHLKQGSSRRWNISIAGVTKYTIELIIIFNFKSIMLRT